MLFGFICKPDSWADLLSRLFLFFCGWIVHAKANIHKSYNCQSMSAWIQEPLCWQLSEKLEFTICDNQWQKFLLNTIHTHIGSWNNHLVCETKVAHFICHLSSVKPREEDYKLSLILADCLIFTVVLQCSLACINRKTISCHSLDKWFYSKEWIDSEVCSQANMHSLKRT